MTAVDQIPVLVIIFNRPHHAAPVIGALRQIRPKRIFIAADGPRADRPGESLLCDRTRKTAIELIDWECQIETAFQSENLGCGRHMTSAITWFFSQVEEGVILEDDCVASVAFFRYTAELLERYRNSAGVMMIAGSALVKLPEDDGADYHFLSFPCCWGWATWRRAWKLMSYEMPDFPDYRRSKAIFSAFPKPVAKRLLTLFEKVSTHAPGFDTWDFQWLYACVKNSGLCIMPALNFVSNIGWDASHERIDEIMAIPADDFKTLRHPAEIKRSIELEQIFYDKIYALPPLWKRAWNKFMKWRKRK